MVNSIGRLIFFIFLIVLPENIFADTFFLNLDSRKSFIFILIIIGIFFLVGLFFLVYYFVNIKRENNVGIYLNLESVWNSPGMIEARQKAPVYMNENLILSESKDDIDAVKNAKFILGFFNHLGLQIYQGLLDFSYVYNLFGNEILDYWDNKNYRYLAFYEKSKNTPFKNQYDGVEYLVNLCYEQNSYRDNSAYFLNTITYPVKDTIKESYYENKNSSSLNILLIISSVLAGFVLIIFIYFYFNYIINM